MSFFEELKRRNIFRMAVLYVASSWLILQAADVLFDALELPPQWVRLVLAVLILGFPAALVFSWLYEITPEGLKRENEIAGSRSTTHQRGRRTNTLIIVLLALGIATVVVDRLIPDGLPVTGSPASLESLESESASRADVVSESPAPDRSVAVLPFANRSAHEDDGYFVDGIHDDILTQLARIGSLTVISRTSVEKFRNTSQSVRQIGDALGVRSILEGSVQRAGHRVRINVQLIDVKSDAHLWAETFDRELTTENIFAIQSEIASAIAAALRATLSRDEMARLEDAPTKDLGALEAYFRGKQAMAKRTSASLAEAERQFKQAIALDPEYALAYIGLADTYTLQPYYSGLPFDEQRQLAKPLIERALAINDRLGEAYITMTEMTDDPETKESLYRKGIELAPGYVTGYQWYGEFLARQGRSGEALAQFDEAARLDPLSSVVRARVADALESLGRFDEARGLIESTLQTEPDFASGYFQLGLLEWLAAGRLDNAIVQMRTAFTVDPGNPIYPANIATLWSDLGGGIEAVRSLDIARSIAGDGLSTYWAALYLKAGQGDVPGAVGDAEAMLAEVGADAVAVRSLSLWILSLNDLHAGHGSAAIERYHAAYPALRDDTVTLDSLNYRPAVDLAYVLQATGDELRASRLLERCLEYLQTRRRLGLSGYFITDVRIYAMQGEKQQALAALRQAVDAGWRVFWRIYLKHDPALASLHSEAEFLAIVAEVETDMASQLRHVRDMEASGELAPIGPYQ